MDNKYILKLPRVAVDQSLTSKLATLGAQPLVTLSSQVQALINSGVINLSSQTGASLVAAPTEYKDATYSITSTTVSVPIQTIDDKVVVLINAELISYTPAATYANVAARDASGAAANTIALVTDSSGDPRYVGVTGARYFKKVGANWQLLPKYTNAVRTIASKTDSTITLSSAVNTDLSSCRVIVAKDYRTIIQNALNSSSIVNLQKGNYLVVLTSANPQITIPTTGSTLNGAGSTINFIQAQNYTDTAVTYSGLSLDSSDVTSNVFAAQIADLTLKAYTAYHPNVETQPQVVGVRLLNGQGEFKMTNITIDGFTEGILSTGDCLTACTDDRVIYAADVKINNILGVAIGLFGRVAQFIGDRLKVTNIGLAASATLLNAEYGHACYFHRNNSWRIQNSYFENIKTHAIIPYSSGDWATRVKFQEVVSCFFKNVSGSVTTDSKFNRTLITNCFFEDCSVSIQGGGTLTDSVFKCPNVGAVAVSTGASQDAPFQFNIANCQFVAQGGYSIYVADSANQAPHINVTGCRFDTSGGTNIEAHGTGFLKVHGCIFTGTAIRSLFADTSVVVDFSHNYIKQTATDQHIKVSGTVVLMGDRNIFTDAKISNTGTGAGYFLDTHQFGTPTITDTNANWSLITRI